MDVQKALTYVFDDEEWLTKIGVGALISLVSILIIPAILLGGWLLATARNVIDGKEHPMADWDDWGGFLRDGGSLALVSLVYASPFILIFCIGFFTTVGFAGLAEANEDAAAAGMFATFGILGCLGFLMGIAIFLITPAVAVQYLRTNQISACFQIGDILGIVRDNIVDIVIIGGVPFAVSFVLGLLNVIPIIGICIGFVLSIVLTPYLSAVTAHLYGQFYLKLHGSKGDKFDAVAL